MATAQRPPAPKRPATATPNAATPNAGSAPTGAPRTLTVETAAGPALVEVHRPTGRARGLLLLGHGAGGDVMAADLTAVRQAGLAGGMVVALVTQPYRLAGRRTPPPTTTLDAAWTAVVGAVRAESGLSRLPMIFGGRSSGARVACRTAAALGAVGVVALAFPLHPPGRPEVSRAGELETGVPTLVVNGERDAFGVPEPGPDRIVVVRPGETHSLSKAPAPVAAAVVDWLRARDWAR